MNEEEERIVELFNGHAQAMGAQECVLQMVSEDGYVICRYVIEPAQNHASAVEATFVQTSDTDYRLYIRHVVTDTFKITTPMTTRIISDLVMKSTQRLLRLLCRTYLGTLPFHPRV